MADNWHRILLHWLALLLASVCAQLKLLPALLLRHKSPEELSRIRYDRKKDFLRTYGTEYGYPGGIVSLDRLRSAEFKRLEAGTVYLDHAGATLHTDGQLRAVLQDLSDNLYGNPHSQNDSSTRTAELMESARSQVLKFCNASEADYKCIFTSGATSALKLVGEAFPWSSDSHYLYAMENHNSVLGLREYALDKGATVTAVDIEPSGYVPGGASGFSLRKPQRRTFSAFQDVEGEVYNLFAFPGECNFSGAKFNLQLVNDVKGGKHVTGVRGKWLVLVDAAKACGTSPPDLSRSPADFVAVSFYKIFGYPTGLGALLVRKDAATLLRKKYFGGAGTVAVSIADVDFMQKRDKLEQWLEDGTPSFLAVAALRHGFALINQLTLPAIQRHTGALTRFTAHKLMSLRHTNGKEVCTLYGNHCRSDGHPTQYWGQQCEQGPVIAFNLKRADGSWVGYREVERFAAINSIHLRGGCFCNPGACAKYIGLSHNELQQNFESGHVCWDDHDVINGKPTGAVRVSFGYMSSYEDVVAFISFIEKYFVETKAANLSCANTKPIHAINGGEPGKVSGKRINPSAGITLESIIVYPIKSCAGFRVQTWALSDTGLLYDREFCIVTASGNTLTQKRNPSMCLIQTWIDLSNGKLHIGARNKREGLELSLTSSTEDDLSSQGPGLSEFHPEVSNWLSDLLGVPCSLLRKKAKNRWTRERQSKICALPTESTSTSAKQRSELSFANEGQFLLVSQASVDDVNKRLVSSGQGSIEVEASQFRPNLVVSGGSPYAEDSWKSVKIGDENFEVLGGCNRCTMININQSTGHRENQFEPLRTLSTYRNFKGQVNFGILLVQENSRPMDPQNHRMLRVGSELLPELDLK